MHQILQYLKDHGEQLDAKIASETGLPLEEVSRCLAELSGRGEVIMCRTTRFIDEEQVVGMLCRISGYFPSASPGRKPKSPK